jgi:hypothetical protein
MEQPFWLLSARFSVWLGGMLGQQESHGVELCRSRFWLVRLKDAAQLLPFPLLVLISRFGWPAR